MTAKIPTRDISITDEELRKTFRRLSSPQDVAQLLELPYSHMTYLVYRSAEEDRYETFSIGKKSGGERLICAPNSSLKILQSKLNKVLQAVYRPRGPAHGFIKDRNIRTNSKNHSRRRYVLNVDLQDFFPSINFGRVRGMFMAKPYSLDPSVATILANICCHENMLPQGAPTSPIVSNMICARLDGHLLRLAKRYGCFYTRYADDITFSTSLKIFPPELAHSEQENNPRKAVVGEELLKAIAGNGFSINTKKTRLQRSDHRQEVTGVVVNQRPNIKRNFYRQVRAMLHAWDRWGYDEAEREFFERYDKKSRRPDSERPEFRQVVKGKISHIGLIRGTKDPLFINLRTTYARLDPDDTWKPPMSPREEILESLWVLENSEFCSGTAFMLEGYGLITCAHVIKGETSAFRPDQPSVRFKVRVIAICDAIDLAVISIDAGHGSALTPDYDFKVEYETPVTIAGFPDHYLGNSGYYATGCVCEFRNVSMIRRFLITAPIVGGNSGGPVLNENNSVIGVCLYRS